VSSYNSSARTPRKTRVIKNACLLARYLAMDICEPHRKHFFCILVYLALHSNGRRADHRKHRSRIVGRLCIAGVAQQWVYASQYISSIVPSETLSSSGLFLDDFRLEFYIQLEFLSLPCVLHAPFISLWLSHSKSQMKNVHRVFPLRASICWSSWWRRSVFSEVSTEFLNVI
jgi:hypothetical protein